jgi:hypothetical protein
VSSAYPEPGGQEFTSGHSGSDTSRERAVNDERSGRARLRAQTVLGYLEVMGLEGLTVKELREVTDWHHGKASSALSNLHKTGEIVRLRESRDKCKVYVLPKFQGNRLTEQQGGKRKVERTYTLHEVHMKAWPEGTKFKVVE